MSDRNVYLSLSMPEIPFNAVGELLEFAETLGVPFILHVDDALDLEEIQPPIIPAPREVPLTFDGEKVGVAYIKPDGEVMIGTLNEEFKGILNEPTALGDISIRPAGLLPSQVVNNFNGQRDA